VREVRFVRCLPEHAPQRVVNLAAVPTVFRGSSARIGLTHDSPDERTTLGTVALPTSSPGGGWRVGRSGAVGDRPPAPPGRLRQDTPEETQIAVAGGRDGVGIRRISTVELPRWEDTVERRLAGLRSAVFQAEQDRRDRQYR